MKKSILFAVVALAAVSCCKVDYKDPNAPIEKRVEALEADLAEWDTKLSAPEEHGIDLSDSKVFEDYNALKQRLAFEEHEWEKLCYELEILQEN